MLRELLGSAVAGRQGEPLQRKHLLSKALKRAHNSLGNHQLVSQARRDHPACVRPVCHFTIMRHRSAAREFCKPHHNAWCSVLNQSGHSSVP